MRAHRALFVAASTIAVFAFAGSAHAFTISSALTDGCHEQVTETALRNVRASLTTAPPIYPDTNDRALIDDLPFDVPADMNELAGASLLVGVRDNDLKGRAATDIDQLATVHGNPADQEEHCLRATDDDEPDGSARAIAACRAFIHDRAMQAVSGLDQNGVPDPSNRIDIKLALSLRGHVTASLPAFWVQIGQAMHALEDSFAHTFRTADGKQITVVLNWIDFVEKEEVESRDGPVHKSDLDKCNAGDDLRNRNKALAEQAATELLMAVLDPSTGPDKKSVAVNAVLDKWLTYSPGCTFDNAWCNAAENRYNNSTGCGCAIIGGGDASGGTVAWLSVTALAILYAMRTRRRSRAAKTIGIGAALLFALSPGVARADEPVRDPDAPAPSQPATSDQKQKPVIDPNAPAAGQLDGTDQTAKPIPQRTTEEAQQAVKEHEHSSPFALTANIGGSIVDPGAAGSIGARFRINDTFVVGLDGELNYWYGVNNQRFDAGAASFYATGIFRFPMRFQPINLRTTVHAGMSYELLDLYGVPKGSVGLYAGIYPLGVEWKLSGHVFLIVNPLGVAIPVPHLTGAPFAYPQFRTQVGVEVAF